VSDPTTVTLHPASHPEPTVHRTGFTLDSPYLEHCWTPILGPSSVLLLRRVASLWRSEAPASIELGDLAAQLGLGQATSTQSPIVRTLRRLERFNFVTWPAGPGIDVYTEVAPLSPTLRRRLPLWSANEHARLLDNRIEELRRLAGVTQPPPEQRMSGRLEQLRSTPVASVPGL
jgi:hypothetical protein